MSDRRDFIKKSFIAGAGFALASQTGLAKSVISNSGPIDISVASGSNAFQNTITAIEQLGGIGKFIPKGTTVGLLINAPAHWTKPGSYTHTDVVLATLKLLNDAGISDITYIINPSPEFYKRSQLSAQYKSIIDNVKNCSDKFIEVDIPKAVIVKKAKVIKDLFEVEALINIPINKHHSGVEYTGCLKNMMGACHRETNMTFHTSGETKDDDVNHLSQCIADINLMRKQDFCITDATEVLRTNGPFGPGEIAKINKVFTGTNPVMMDTFGCTLLDNRPQDILMLGMAQKHGLGRTDLKNFNIKETLA